MSVQLKEFASMQVAYEIGVFTSADHRSLRSRLDNPRSHEEVDYVVARVLDSRFEHTIHILLGGPVDLDYLARTDDRSNLSSEAAGRGLLMAAFFYHRHNSRQVDHDSRHEVSVRGRSEAEAVHVDRRNRHHQGSEYEAVGSAGGSFLDPWESAAGPARTDGT